MNWKIFSILTFFLLFNSCDYVSSYNRLKKRKNRKIEIPFDLNKDHSIISFVNGDCPRCIETVKLFGQLYYEYDSLNIDCEIITIISGYQGIEVFRKFFSEQNYLPRYVIDSFKQIAKMNDISLNDIDYNTFLINKDGRIVLIGNPVINKNVNDLVISYFKDSQK